MEAQDAMGCCGMVQRFEPCAPCWVRMDLLCGQVVGVCGGGWVVVSGTPRVGNILLLLHVPEGNHLAVDPKAAPGEGQD